MRKRGLSVLLSAVVVAQLAFSPISAQAATTLYDSKTGKEDGYDYELWKDRGTTSMTLTGNGTFECSWSNINNALFRTGKKFDSTKTYQQIGNISVDYGCNYQPNGNSYLCVYGWTVEPLVEYYVVDSWGTWRPPGSTPKGQITVDGGTYDVYETTRYNQPSIKGDTTFQQYWSVRTSKKTSGTISVSEHFKAWERMGMKCGKLYETALTVEGYQSSGTAKVYKNNITIGGSSNNNPVVNPTQAPTTQPNTGAVNTANTMQCENMTLSGQYAGKTNTPFSGVALYANDDTASYTQQFGTDTHDFTLRGCSNNNNTAAVDLKIDGAKKGTFYFKGSTPTDVTLKNIKHATGNVKVELTVSTDDNTWDAYIDSLMIGSASSATQSPTKAPTVAPTQAPQQSVTGNIADGWYYIKGVGSQKYLQVENSSAQANANVVIANGNGNAGQVWKVTNTNDGYITLTSKLGNFMLDVANGSSEDGANVGIYDAYSGDAQKFVAKEVSNGIYTINTKSSNSQKVLDVSGRSTTAGANVCQYRSNGQTNQQWQFELVTGQVEQPTVAPTKTPTQAPTVAPTQAPQQSASGVSCSYKTTGDWGSGFQGEIIIKNNTSNVVNGWTATFTTNAKINSLWGATLVGQSGSTVTVKNCDWDTTLAPNASVSIGFVADGNAANSAPTNFKFNGTAVDGGQTQQPTVAPTQVPTKAPTQAPTVAPTVAPTQAPTQAPTVAPSQPVNVTVETYCPSNLQQKIAGVQYGTLQKKSYYSTTCAKMRNVNVLLPAGYTTSKKYPVLYVLHGIFGDENSMVGNCDKLIGNMIAKGLAKDMIVVFPYMFASRTQNQCTGFDDANFAAYDNFVNDLADDLMPWMAKNYSIATGKANTAITGFSMGGRESLAIGIQRSDLFGYVGAVAPAPGLVAAVDGFATHKGMFQESQMKFSKGDPYLVMVCSGDKDSVVGTFPMDYHNIFVKNNVKHTWWIVPGSDHGDPAISSNIYNFAKNIF